MTMWNALETQPTRSDAKGVGYRFYAVPAHRLTEMGTAVASKELVEPDLPEMREGVERALAGAEFRNLRARDKLRSLLASDVLPTIPTPFQGFGPTAVFAQPPDDLPALLRLADQLDKLAKQEAGESAVVWKCGGCGTRYAVPVALVRSVSIQCEKCGQPVPLEPRFALGEEHLMDPLQGTVNRTRKQLAEFFREAMARGWPVLVCSREGW